jgi:hypothetical protein
MIAEWRLLNVLKWDFSPSRFKISYDLLWEKRAKYLREEQKNFHVKKLPFPHKNISLIALDVIRCRLVLKVSTTFNVNCRFNFYFSLLLILALLYGLLKFRSILSLVCSTAYFLKIIFIFIRFVWERLSVFNDRSSVLEGLLNSCSIFY